MEVYISLQHKTGYRDMIMQGCSQSLDSNYGTNSAMTLSILQSLMRMDWEKKYDIPA
jgi:hypothetical protein